MGKKSKKYYCHILVLHLTASMLGIHRMMFLYRFFLYFSSICLVIVERREKLWLSHQLSCLLSEERNIH